jgi:hypothetical protein
VDDEKGTGRKEAYHQPVKEYYMPVPMCGIIAASANAMNQARKREKMCNLKGDNKEYCEYCLRGKAGECIEKQADKE